nr:hypothetical protein GCM10020093_075270 [Planobispora longispora]
MEMFGIVRPCRHGMCGGLFAAWMAHLCGLCLALRDEHGHAARLVTNYDGLLVSVLTEAQAPALSPRREAAPARCAGSPAPRWSAPGPRGAAGRGDLADPGLGQGPRPHRRR